MGDGGICITKIEDIKKEWSDIRPRIKEVYDCHFEKRPYRKEIYDKEYKSSLDLPNDINSLSDKEICELLRGVMSNYDTPYLLESYIITGYGTNLNDISKDLFYLLPEWDQIETWS
jgi:hypothetical protein